MALESVAALSLASSIVQFLDFGGKLFSTTKELYTSTTGLLADNVELETIASSLSHLSEDLANTHSKNIRPSPTDTDLANLAQDCKKIADELLAALDQLRLRGSGTKWQCFRVALKKIWRSAKIEEMVKRLDACRSQLTTCLMKTIEYGNVSLSFGYLLTPSWTG